LQDGSSSGPSVIPLKTELFFRNTAIERPIIRDEAFFMKHPYSFFA
jgi:hypothetical protein